MRTPSDEWLAEALDVMLILGTAVITTLIVGWLNVVRIVCLIVIWTVTFRAVSARRAHRRRDR